MGDGGFLFVMFWDVTGCVFCDVMFVFCCVLKRESVC